MSIYALGSQTEIHAMLDAGQDPFEKFTNVVSHLEHNKNKTAKGGMTVYEYAIGRVLREWERNMYDDSDFFCSYWDDETQTVQTVMFATTRGWSYPCLATHVDATPEVRKLAEAYLLKQERHHKAQCLSNERKKLIAAARMIGLTNYVPLLRLKKAFIANYLTREFDWVMDLLTKNIRSAFKKSLREQVLLWLKGASEYALPLTKKQLKCLEPVSRSAWRC